MREQVVRGRQLQLGGLSSLTVLSGLKNTSISNQICIVRLYSTRGKTIRLHSALVTKFV
jgi:hypothetical protein